MDPVGSSRGKAHPPSKRRYRNRQRRYAANQRQQFGQFRSPVVGAPSLHSQCIRLILANLSTFLNQDLRNVPTAIVQQIWRAYRRRRQESLHVWKMFVATGHADATFSHSLVNEIKSPLFDFYNTITSANFEWITHLTLEKPNCSSSDYKNIAYIFNLQSLSIRFFSKIEKEAVFFNDKIVSYWASKVRYDGALKSLARILIFNAPGITSAIFPQLSAFDSMQEIKCLGTSIEREHEGFAKECGWQYKVNQFLDDAAAAAPMDSEGEDRPPSLFVQLHGHDSRIYFRTGVDRLLRFERLPGQI